MNAINLFIGLVIAITGMAAIILVVVAAATKDLITINALLSILKEQIKNRRKRP